MTDLLAKYGIDPDDIPSGEEMLPYIHPLWDTDKGMIFYDPRTNEPRGLAITERGLKFFSPLSENTIIYQGGLTRDYYPHGQGCLYNGQMFIKANFLDGHVNSKIVFKNTSNGVVSEACYLCGIKLY